MPLEHFSSGVILSISDEELQNPNFHETYRIKWERMQEGLSKYRRKPLRAVVRRNVEGDGFDVILFAPKRHLIANGVTVKQDMASTYNEVLRQYGEILA